MTNHLLPIASHWAGEWVACRFKAWADGSPLTTADDSEPFYDIPNGTSEVKVTVTPTAPVYWENTITLSVSGGGVISVKDSPDTLVKVRTVAGTTTQSTVANIKVSRFKDVTADVLDLLKHPPSKRMFKIGGNWVQKTVDEVQNHTNLYGTWPPPDWDLHDVRNAHSFAHDTTVVEKEEARFIFETVVSMLRFVRSVEAAKFEVGSTETAS